MLFAPELEQRFGKPTALPQPAMDLGMAGGAERDKKFFPMIAREPVMDGQTRALRLPCPIAFSTTPAAAAVAGEDGVAVAGEVAARMHLGAIAFQAEAGDRRLCFATGAKENCLPGPRKPAAERLPAGGNGPGSSGLCARRCHQGQDSRSALDNIHYHKRLRRLFASTNELTVISSPLHS